jgi:hypothetical protein
MTMKEELYKEQLEKKADLELVHKAQDHQFKSDFGKVFSSTEGQRVLYRILEHCRVFNSTYTNEPMDMARREGERRIGLWMLAHCSSELYMKMLMEQKKEV